MITYHFGPPEIYNRTADMVSAAAYGVGFAVAAGDLYVSNGSAWVKVVDADDGSVALTNVLTGFTSGAGVVAATDTILEAIQKLDGNVDTKATDLLTGFTSGAGVVAATDTVLEAIQKLDGNVAAKATDLLTGFTSGAGVVAATDTVLEAIQKLDGNVAAKADPVLAADGDFYVATSSEGAVTTKLTFTNGILTAIT